MTVQQSGSITPGHLAKFVSSKPMNRLAAWLALGLLAATAAPALAQAPSPVPALPDTERRTSYSITAGTGPYSVGFALYGDSTDYGNWLEVWCGATKLTPVTDWTLALVSGTLATAARPLTNAQVTLTAAQTCTLQIVGARRPRRLSQYSENRGVAARDLNVTVTDLVAENREQWDLLRRALVGVPGEVITAMPPAATRAGKFLYFDVTGLIPQFTGGGPGTGNVVGPPSSTDNAITRFDGASGLLLQNSSVLLGDAGDVSGVRTFYSSVVSPTSSTLPTQEGFLRPYTLISVTGDNLTRATPPTCCQNSSALAVQHTYTGSVDRWSVYIDSTLIAAPGAGRTFVPLQTVTRAAVPGSGSAMYGGLSAYAKLLPGATGWSVLNAGEVNYELWDTDPLYPGAPAASATTKIGFAIVAGDNDKIQASGSDIGLSLGSKSASSLAANRHKYGIAIGDVHGVFPVATTGTIIGAPIANAGLVPTAANAIDFGQITVTNALLRGMGHVAAYASVILAASGVTNIQPGDLAAVRAGGAGFLFFGPTGTRYAGYTGSLYEWGGTAAVHSTGARFVNLTGTAPAASLYASSTDAFVASSSAQAAYRAITASATAAISPATTFTRSRGTVTAPTAVLSGDQLFEIVGNGFATNSTAVVGAKIIGLVDAALGASDMPGRLVFATTASGASTATERLRITSAGVVQPGADGTQDFGTSALRWSTTFTNTITGSGAADRTWSLAQAAAAASGGALNIAASSSGAGTDLSGGNLNLKAGASTGAGTSVITFQGAPAQASGTGSNTVAEVMRVVNSNGYALVCFRTSSCNASNYAITGAAGDTVTYFNGETGVTVRINNSPIGVWTGSGVAVTGTITASTNFISGASTGLSATKTVRDSAGTGTCTLIFTGGILTGGSC